MPLEVENKLKARASQKGFKGKRWRAYVFGTMQKRGLLEAPVSSRAIEFEDDPEEKRRKLLKKLAGLGLGAGAATLAYQNPALRGIGTGVVKGIARSLRPKPPRVPGLLARIHPRLVELAKKIDLGERRTKSDCMPCKPGETRYPSLYIYDREEPIDIPKTGKALIDYRVCNRSMSQKQDEPEKYTTDIEVHSIEPFEPKSATGRTRRGEEGETAKLLHDLRRVTGFDDPRKRNSLGEFVGNETDGVDPNSMAAAYGPPAVQPVNPMSESHITRIQRFFGKRRETQEKL